jgi:hypothetical protein
MFSVEQIKSQAKYQKIVTSKWINCKDLASSDQSFAMYNEKKEALGFATVRLNDLGASFACFAMEDFSNQEVLRDFFFKGILGILSMQGVFFIDAEAACKDLMKEFSFTANTDIESLLKGSCSHDS